MKERPLPFSAAMVRATLREVDPKSQTRRTVKPQPRIDEWGNFLWGKWNFGQDISGNPRVQAIASPIPNSSTKRVHCPYGAPGDRLYVREAYIVSASFDAMPPRELSRDAAIHYLADGEAPAWFSRGRYRHARFMPRWASRINLEVTGVRVERLQEICENDAKAEGVNAPAWIKPATDEEPTWRGGYRKLWQSINGAESWAANPFVWVVEFKRVLP